MMIVKSALLLLPLLPLLPAASRLPGQAQRLPPPSLGHLNPQDREAGVRGQAAGASGDWCSLQLPKPQAGHRHLRHPMQKASGAPGRLWPPAARESCLPR